MQHQGAFQNSKRLKTPSIYLTNAFNIRKLAKEEQPSPTWRPRGTLPAHDPQRAQHQNTQLQQTTSATADLPFTWPERRAHLLSLAFGSTRTSDATLCRPLFLVSARAGVRPQYNTTWYWSEATIATKYLLTVNYCCCLNYSDNYYCIAIMY